MKSHPTFFYLILSTFLLTMLNSGKAQELPEEILNWKGTWYTIHKQDTIFERWTIEPDGNMKGESWSIKTNKDSVHSEYIRLYAKEKTIIYEPLVNAQHGNKPVSFHLMLQTSSYWIFYNEENDFPKFITYKRISENQLKAVISNSDNPDATNSLEFNYSLYRR
jgi:lipocalin